MHMYVYFSEYNPRSAEVNDNIEQWFEYWRSAKCPKRNRFLEQQQQHPSGFSHKLSWRLIIDNIQHIN